MAHSKLPLNRPFTLTDQQKKDADHIYSVDREDPSRIVYYPTGRPGAGTEGYNSPSPLWAPKPASRQDGHLPVKTEEIRNPGQVPALPCSPFPL